MKETITTCDVCGGQPGDVEWHHFLSCSSRSSRKKQTEATETLNDVCPDCFSTIVAAYAKVIARLSGK